MSKTTGPTLVEFLLARIAEDEAPLLDLPGNALLRWRWGPRPVGELRRRDRMLAECEAKRWIVEYRAAFFRAEPAENLARDGILTHLAQPYSDHPDYDPAWAI